jgi:hypothetical protein
MEERFREHEENVPDFLPYLQLRQSACMFHISYGLQWRLGLRYIADIKGSAK